MSEINNTQVDNAKDIDVVMPVFNLIKYSNNYLKTSGSLWQFCRDKAGLKHFFVCSQPTDPTLELLTQNILLEL